MHFDSPFACLTYTLASTTLDGLPGVGPYAFPPRCVEDTEWARRVRDIYEEVSELLSSERGRRLCRSDHPILLDGASDARTWGLEIHSLEHAIKRRLPVSTCRYSCSLPGLTNSEPST